MLNAELRLLLLEVAAAGTELLQQWRRKVARGPQPGLGGEHQLRIAGSGGAIFCFALNAFGDGIHQFPTECVHFTQFRDVLHFGWLAASQRLRSVQDSMLSLECSELPIVVV